MADAKRYVHRVERISKGLKIEWDELQGPDWWLWWPVGMCVGAWLLQAQLESVPRALAVVVAVLLTMYVMYTLLGELVLAMLPRWVRRLDAAVERLDDDRRGDSK